jgi:phosphoribosylformylglycinamidine synthase
MVGLIEDTENKMSCFFKNEDDLIYLLGVNKEDFNCSEYLHQLNDIEFSPAPYFDLDEEKELHDNVSLLIQRKIIESAHDISEGGLFVTLAESAFYLNKGFTINCQKKDIRRDAYYFGEAQGRVVVSVKPGKVKAQDFVIDNENWGDVLSWKKLYDTSISSLL